MYDKSLAEYMDICIVYRIAALLLSTLVYILNNIYGGQKGSCW